MTPEERAEEIIKQSIAFWHGDDDAKLAVIAAIRAAENDALERAAKEAEVLSEDEFDDGWIIARNIRRLKVPFERIPAEGAA